jgi:hypothetical protein
MPLPDGSIAGNRKFMQPDATSSAGAIMSIAVMNFGLTTGFYQVPSGSAQLRKDGFQGHKIGKK